MSRPPAAVPHIEITIEEDREYDSDHHINIKYIPLYMALVKGELEVVNAFLDKHPEAIYDRVSIIGETPMHVAFSHGKVELVEVLFKRMEDMSDSDDEKLCVKDAYGDTPLHIAARAANTTISKRVLDRPDWLVSLTENPDGELPVNLAAIYDNWSMLFELANCSRLSWRRADSFLNWSTFREFINCEQFGLAREFGEILEGSGPMDFKDGLYTMAEMVSAFSQPGYFKRWIYYLSLLPYGGRDPEISSVGTMHGGINQRISFWGKMLNFLKASKVGKAIESIVAEVRNNKQAHELLNNMCSPEWTFDINHVEVVYFEALKRAIKCGNVEFVEEMLRSNPALLWGGKKSGSIFHLAVAWRQEKIWNLIYGLTTEQRNKITGRLVKSNTILHIAACPLVMNDKYRGLLSKDDSENQGEQQHLPLKEFSKARDAALIMQRELQWYEEVKRMVPSSYKLKANEYGETPPDLDSSYHYELMKEGEKWMRDTAESFTIVATLIVTVMFAATFTLPGGTDDNGNPKFLMYKSFMVYITADALSLLTSTISLLMFLSIITSRYIQQSFRWSLHTRLITGLATLFISIATMMVAFGATLVIVLGERISWSPTPITLFSGAASVPAIIFAWLQFPMFLNLVSSTYGHALFKRRTKCSFLHNLRDLPKPKEP
ncbi:uncharacterized protein LOC132274378 [Cornus florida]|uniref:uncharacterized protein LOC132274378 n=1 Tax=Cornus florida TaxID=4283 RepID=UPI00289E18AC|nr:uncharacterized protein LOC132274378 [Cornus florida]